MSRMVKIDLTPEDLLALDPTGRCTKAVMRYPMESEYHEKPSSFYNVTPDEVKAFVMKLDDRIAQQTHKHDPYLEVERDMYPKFGPQGGAYSQAKMLELATAYYAAAEQPITIPIEVYRARDYLIRHIKGIVGRVGYPQLCAYSSLRTFAGLPWGGRKGSFMSETLNASPWRHVVPAIPGQRRMRGKDRLIFQDATSNVRYVERYLGAVRHWLRTNLPQYFGAWLNPHEVVHPTLSALMYDQSAVSIEWDYRGMDIGITFQLIRELVLPVYEALMPDGFLSFAAYVEEWFNQPLFFGTYLLTGSHSLFSGGGPTNDFETILSVLLCLSLELAHTLQQRTKAIAALGDDVVYGVKLPTNRAEELFKEVEGWTAAMGMSIHPLGGKSRISRTDVRFCRRVYYPGMPKPEGDTGSYPLILVANNIIQPERPIADPGVAAVADLARLDNALASPGYNELVLWLASHAWHKFILTPEDVAKYNSESDWWTRLYGEKWSPTTSPTFRLLDLRR